MKPFDLEAAKAGAPVIQRCGRPARIVDFALQNEDYPLAVIYADEYGDEHVTEFSVEGKYYDHSSEDYRDLMMAPVKKEAWVNINRSRNPIGAAAGGVYGSREEADRNAARARIACIHVDWEE